MIFSLPVNAVRLERISAIGAKDDGSSAGFKGTNHFADGGAIILYVFDHFMAEDQIKGRRRKRNIFSGSVEDVRRVDPGFGSTLEVIFQADDGSPKRGDVLYVHAHPAAIFQNITLHAFARRLDD